MSHGGRRPGAGRPAFQPTELQRSQVFKLKLRGLTNKDICEVIGPDPRHPIAESTLKRAFAAELARGASLADAEVAASLYVQAVGAPAVYDNRGQKTRAEVHRVTAAGIFWMKARCNWSDQPKAQPIDPDTTIVIEGGLPKGPREPDLPDPVPVDGPHNS